MRLRVAGDAVQEAGRDQIRWGTYTQGSFQDPQGMLETKNSTELLNILCFFLYIPIIKFYL